MLAANIGAGSTVGATGLGYALGISAWWWVGSAAIGSCGARVLGDRPRDAAAGRKAHQLRTVSGSDFLEHRYERRGPRARGWRSSGSAHSSFSPGQLWAIGSIIGAVAGTTPWIGCAIGGVVITVYFTAGGLLTSAWVNVVQLTVKMIGFGIALPLALSAAGGLHQLSTVQPTSDYWQFWRAGSPGLSTLAILVPPFIVSPGLLQKIFGARDDRAVRIGVGLNALGLVIFAIVPALLGIVARSQFPALPTADAALPMLLVHSLPPLVGALGLAAVFSAEISASDAILFMLTTSLSQDLYKRFINREASDDRVLRLARWTAVLSGAAVHDARDRAWQRHQRAGDLLHAGRRLAVRADSGRALRAPHVGHGRAAHDGGGRVRRARGSHRDRRSRLWSSHAGAGRPQRGDCRVAAIDARRLTYFSSIVIA